MRGGPTRDRALPRRNKRRILRIFTLPPAAETPPEPNFYDSMKKIRLRQQLEMYSIGEGAVGPRVGPAWGGPEPVSSSGGTWGRRPLHGHPVGAQGTGLRCEGGQSRGAVVKTQLGLTVKNSKVNVAKKRT